MFGWEFPPFKSGGLGTACHDLTKGLARQGVSVTFVMPVAPQNAKAPFVKLVGANKYSAKITFKALYSPLSAYANPKSYEETYVYAAKNSGSKNVYGKDLFSEVQRYAAVAARIASEEEHDIIHAHDWMTYGAAINAKRISGKPLVVHIHATEFDRTLGHPNSTIQNIEHAGFVNADVIIANSNFLKQTVVSKYNISPAKIRVVHWGIDQDSPAYSLNYKSPMREKLVLFLGRMAVMKGPDHFLKVAQRVLAFEPRTKFVMVGGGEMMPYVVRLAAELGISQNVIFTGTLSGEDTHKAFQLADVFVMPSVSEPFGLVALEALKNNTPVIVSRQSGVSEVLHHALKVDFWDHDEMVNKIVAVLRYASLRDELRERGAEEAEKFDIETPARKCIAVYNDFCKQVVVA